MPAVAKNMCLQDKSERLFPNFFWKIWENKKCVCEVNTQIVTLYTCLNTVSNCAIPPS